MSYKISVNRDLCIGAATCVAAAPKTFKLDGEAKAVVLPGPNDDDNTMLDAAKSCPTDAISIINETTGEKLWPLEK